MLLNIRNSTTHERAGQWVRGGIIVLLLFIGACQSSPPVQEMSDARQAIAVARAAGAEKLAEADFRAAESSLANAQRKLSEHAYSQARRDALEAREKALEALAISEHPEFQR